MPMLTAATRRWARADLLPAHRADRLAVGLDDEMVALDGAGAPSPKSLNSPSACGSPRQARATGGHPRGPGATATPSAGRDGQQRARARRRRPRKAAMTAQAGRTSTVPACSPCSPRRRSCSSRSGTVQLTRAPGRCDDEAGPRSSAGARPVGVAAAHGPAAERAVRGDHRQGPRGLDALDGVPGQPDVRTTLRSSTPSGRQRPRGRAHRVDDTVTRARLAQADGHLAAVTSPDQVPGPDTRR